MVRTPNVTVAAAIERDGRFLLIEEETERGTLFNQPAGHLGPDESLVTGIIRKTLDLITDSATDPRWPSNA